MVYAMRGQLGLNRTLNWSLLGTTDVHFPVGLSANTNKYSCSCGMFERYKVRLFPSIISISKTIRVNYSRCGPSKLTHFKDILRRMASYDDSIIFFSDFDEIFLHTFQMILSNKKVFRKKYFWLTISFFCLTLCQTYAPFFGPFLKGRRGLHIVN